MFNIINQKRKKFMEKIQNKKISLLPKTETTCNKSVLKKNESVWSSDEEQKLIELLNTNKNRNWKNISDQLPGHTPNQCYNHWQKIIRKSIIKGPWSKQEDKLLMDWVKKNGEKHWTKCSEVIIGRSGKQCREHWNNSLNPNVKKGQWTSEEDFLIMYFYKKYEGSWKEIINLFQRRTENSIKNRFFSQLRKIASENLNSEEKRLTSKIKLETLLKYLDIATNNAKKNYLK